MRQSLIGITFIFYWTSLFCQSTILDEYVHLALKQNLALKQKTFSLEHSMSALKEARGMFLPSISIEARYSRAGGGREISIPVGDLMNPVYATLNQMLAQSGMPEKFPENIPNVSEPFLREKEHETRIRLIQPIYQPGIYYNYKIKQNFTDIEKAAKHVYIRHLIADVKTAYFNYLKTIQIDSLLQTTEKLLQENLRISQSLFEQDKVTQAVVFRAEAELHAFHQQQAEAEKHREMARAYFNFLLNRPMEANINITDNFAALSLHSVDLEAAKNQAIHQREEIRQIQNVIEISNQKVGLSRSAFLPGIVAVVDYGFQGEEYRFNAKDDYWMANLVASWNLFNGFQDKYKIDQAQSMKKQIQTQFEEVKNQIQLQVLEAYHNLNVALKNIDAAIAQEKSSVKSFNIVVRQFKEGKASHIEFIDARSTKTQAEVNAIVAQYDYYIRQAEFEKVIADDPISLIDVQDKE